MKRFYFSYYLFATALIFGFILTLQLKSNLSFEGIVTIQQLVNMEKDIQNTSVEKKNLIDSIQDTKSKIDEYNKGIEQKGSIYDSMKTELERVQTIAGLKATQGPGIIVVLTDSTNKLAEGESLQWFLIHDIDILEVVNELRASGAEEISINGERVMPNTSIRCGGPTIIIDGKRHAIPFIIRAVGDPKTLEASMLAPDSYIYFLRDSGFDIKVKKVENLIIDPYIGPQKFKYIKMVEGGEKK